MNNEEFAAQLAELILDLNSTGIDNLKQVILDCLTENDLKVIDTKNQLLGYSVEDVISYYYQDLEYYQQEYPNAPDELTYEKGLEIFNIFLKLNENKNGEFCWDDIHKAITDWLITYDS